MTVLRATFGGRRVVLSFCRDSYKGHKFLCHFSAGEASLPRVQCRNLTPMSTIPVDGGPSVRPSAGISHLVEIVTRVIKFPQVVKEEGLWRDKAKSRKWGTRVSRDAPPDDLGSWAVVAARRPLSGGLRVTWEAVHPWPSLDARKAS